MSVICQNFVQNAWKKDLCSNCFKSVGDHDNSIILQNDNHNNHHHNGDSHHHHVKSSMAATTTVFQTSHQSTPHTTWKTLISEKNAKNGQQPFKLETGFQGRLLTINKATNGVGEKKTDHPEVKKSNGQLTSFRRSASSDDLLNGHSKTNGFHHATTNCSHQPPQNGTSTRVKSPTGVELGERKTLVKSKSDECPPTAPLHRSILKKTVSNPPQSNPSPRRGSNVGFKDEEPLVIGYGGRDFSPEELEWDMNVSDVDHGSDSLDETEDDKAFSKMTRQNTEFNSDNANLLKAENGASRKPSEKTESGDSSVPKEKKDELIGIVKEKKDEEAGIPEGKRDEEARKPIGKKDEEAGFPKGKKDEQSEIQKPSEPKDGEDEKDKFDFKTEAPMTSNQTVSAAASIVIAHNERDVTEKGDKGGGCVAPSPADQNSPGASVEAPPRQSNLEMFSEEQVGKNANTLPEENNEWQDESSEDGVAGQILQAINTSLTNRHKMNEPVDPPAEEEVAVKTPVVKVVLSASSDEDASTLVEPRTSFLHGNKKAKPSAIYGPASDLFVTRSDSSSSSSSDEFKNEGPRSISVILNGARHDEETEKPTYSSIQETSLNGTTNKFKPEIPAKPAKSLARPQKKFIAKTQPAERKDSDSSDAQNGYYSVGNASTYSDGPKSITLVDHYAESNIYHEVEDPEMKLPDSNSPDKAIPRESKLAALAMELEQVRHCNGNTKRQAPAPPKVPEPPLEDPPNSTGRTSPISLDSPHGFSSYRGEAMAFSSSSSTASTSSQDTETGYASWNIHGDLDDHRKNSKSKSSFLLAQYSKCKMLAMGYTEDSAKAKKRFSLKKLLKIQKKESEAPPGFDSNGPNPKAWKYSDHFERPRAKLEIIHPMDLENKNVTVNPGFDSLHSGSMSSFTVSADDLSLRNSVSSDYGSFYSDAVSPVHDTKPEVNYECIPQQNSMTLEEQEEPNEATERGGSNSPTPSRTSTVSQASTLTSGSSKNGGGSPHRPPKPPPPPRAHSLLPGSKALNPDGTFKFPVPNGIAVNNSDPVAPPTKPQAPKRQCKSSPPKTDCGIYDNAVVDTTPTPVEQVNEEPASEESGISAEENPYGTVIDVQASNLEKSVPEISESTKAPIEPEVVDSAQSSSQPTAQEVKAEPQAINVSVKVKPMSEPVEKVAKNTITRSRNSPVTKAPARPPPIYMKSPISGIVKNPNPWKTLEDSYLVLTASNRELLVKLVNQALKKRKNYVSKLQNLEFQWSDFEIDMEQPSAVFAFGEKIAYHATMPEYPEFAITLVVTVQQQHDRMNENGILKYPVFGHFVDYIPKELLDENYASDAELESMQATILVLDRSNISTIECFSESLPSSLAEEHEKELCFIILQLIHSLKSLQAHGIESIDPSFQNLVLTKTRNDQYNSLIFLSDGCYDDDSDYVTDCNKISLCQYTLMLLFQMLGIQSAEEFFLPPPDKFSSEMSRRVFETAVSLLSEEKAVSLSQTKTLFECFLWGVTGIVKKIDDSDDIDSVLQRWLDIKRSVYIKTLIDDDGLCDINVQSEYFSQFLTRTSVRNIKEVVSYL